MKKSLNIYVSTFFVTGLTLINMKEAYALPAFAVREGVSCVRCHSNGAAPHLTKAGYLYRRAGFRFPEEIGKIETAELKNDIPRFFSAGANVDYQLISSKSGGQTKADVTNNEINVREVEIWPLVGGFKGNFGIWSELDLNPAAGSNSASSALNQADMRFVKGSADNFFNFRVGLIAPEGYGASDQWLDDGNLPLIETQTAKLNGIDTLATPLGALQTPQMGAEFGYNYFDTHATLGIYNGFDGTNGSATNPVSQSTLVRNLTNKNNKGSKDFKIQVDQFLLNDLMAITAVYYHGAIPLLDSTNTNIWVNHYSMFRLYGTFSLVPSKLDLLLGVGQGTNEKYDTTISHSSGDYKNRGGFLGAMYFAAPHLNFAARMDYYNDSHNAISGIVDPRTIAYSLMINHPYENMIFSVHFNRTLADQAALVTNDLRAEWRVLF